MDSPLTNRSPQPQPAISGQRPVLLLSPYDAYSHQQWRQTLISMFPEFDWTVLTLPPRYFAWRVRGNSLSWAFEQREILDRHYDLLICTSLTDLSGLRGLLPTLATVPTLVYFHENQFAYPANVMDTAPDDKPNISGNAPATTRTNQIAPQSIEAAMLNIYTALCADQVLFNSEWNLQSFLSGCAHLLRKLPDHVPPQITELIAQKSAVQAVPLPDALFELAADNKTSLPANLSAFNQGSLNPAPLTQGSRTPGKNTAPLNIVWNHRHEYDKGPALLLAIVKRLVQTELSFRLHLLGQRFRKRPSEFNEIDRTLTGYYQDREITPGINQWLEDRTDYLTQLASADIVLSTALHDFQGLAVQEACILGCLPLVPDALAYPEFIPQIYRFDASGNVSQQADSAVTQLLTITNAQRHQTLPAIDLHALQASHCRDEWLTHLNKLL